MTETAIRSGGWEESGRSCSMAMNSEVSASATSPSTLSPDRGEQGEGEVVGVEVGWEVAGGVQGA
jgi:hypothetical protein